jgi:5-methylcytosine-specific restriction protein A
MPKRPPTPCSFRGQPACATLVFGGGGKCDEHKTAARRASAKFRRERGEQPVYGASHRGRFRRGVLRKHPHCQCDLLDHNWHPGGPCPHGSTDADHWPIDKRALLALGMDSDDPAHGRGLCHRCHSSSTARLQPGGWHRPRSTDAH